MTPLPFALQEVEVAILAEAGPPAGMYAPYGSLVMPVWQLEAEGTGYSSEEVSFAPLRLSLAVTVGATNVGGAVTGPVSNNGPTVGAGPYTPRLEPAPGGGYDVVITDPETGEPIVIGFLPPGSDPNAPFTVIVDGRLLTVRYGGAAIATYLIPVSVWATLVSTFWVGFRDAVTGEQVPTPPGFEDPVGEVPLAGWLYRLDTSRLVRPLGFKPHLWLHAGYRVEDDVAIMADGSVEVGSPLPDEVAASARLLLQAGRVHPLLSYEDAVLLYEGGLGDRLYPV